MGPASRPVRLVLGLVVGVLFVMMAVALAVLWPTADTEARQHHQRVDRLPRTTVTGVQAVPCGPMACEAVRAELGSGAPGGVRGGSRKLTPGAATPTLQVGDRIVVTQEISLLADAPTYAFADFQRRPPL
jgi:hypothetical protein